MKDREDIGKAKNSTIMLEDSDCSPRYPGAKDQRGVVQCITHNKITLYKQVKGHNRYKPSLIINTLFQPPFTFLTRAGMLVELVANPIPKHKAAGFPTNEAIKVSNFL